jgi:hypothetical protein
MDHTIYSLDMSIQVKSRYLCTLVVEDYFRVLPIDLMYIPSSPVSASRCSIPMHVATEKELTPRLPRLLVDTVRIYQELHIPVQAHG